MMCLESFYIFLDPSASETHGVAVIILNERETDVLEWHLAVSISALAHLRFIKASDGIFS